MRHPDEETLYVTDTKTGGVKGLKLQRFDLVPVEPQIALAEHYGKNAKEHGGKYEVRNWEKGYAWSLSYGAIKRHLEAWWLGEDIDAESGSNHLTAVAWHAFALFWFWRHKRGTDDRSRPGMVAWKRSDAAGDEALNKARAESY